MATFFLQEKGKWAAEITYDLILWMKNLILTNMCMVYTEDKILFQIRQKGDWPGLTFPGGHVENGEDDLSSCLREMKEETGLSLFHLEDLGEFIWDWEDVHRCKLYRTSSFKGELLSSVEGKMLWLTPKESFQYSWSNDLDKIIKIMVKGLPFAEIFKN